MGDRRVADILPAEVGRHIARSIGADDFRWVKSRMAIVRRTTSSTQMVALEPTSTPSYHPSAILALHPLVIVTYPELADLVAIPEVTRPFSSIGQPLRYGTTVRDDWYVLEPADAGRIATEIADLIRSHALPLLNDVVAVDGFLTAFERSDPRILWHDQVRVGVVAAYVAQGNIDAARSLVAQRFRGPARHLLPPRLAQAVGEP